MSPRRRIAAIASRRSPRPFHSLAVLLALVIACNSPAPSGSSTAPSPSAATPSQTATAPSNAPSTSPGASGSGGVDASYRQIEEQVIGIRGLQPKNPVNPVLLDDAGLKDVTRKDFEKSNPPDLVAANDRVFKAFGLIGEDQSLKDLYLELLGSAVAGLYSPDTKKLYVVSRQGTVGVVQRSTFAHEFTHALQDQNFSLDSLKLDERGQSDRSFARLSLIEGDATLAQTEWTFKFLTSAELQQLLTESASDPSNALLAKVPRILRETLLFPYTTGLLFVQRIQTSAGWPAVNQAYADPPASTEQIIHPEKYDAHEAPLPADIPADLASRLGAGWASKLVDTVGEFQLRVWLARNEQLGAGGADKAAAGWGGDRVELMQGPGGSWVVVLHTLWDSPAEAAEFEAAAAPNVESLAHPAKLLPGAAGAERWIVIASDDATLARAASTLGLAG